MKSIITTFLFSVSVITAFSQNVGINTDGSVPGMMLDVKTTTTATSDGIRINNSNAGDGDAILNFQNNAISVWTIGFDDSDADKFKFSQSGALGTSDMITIETDGDVGIGTTTPITQLHVVSTGVQDAIFGQATNVGAYLGYETNFTFGVTPQAINGSGVWAANPSAGYTSSYAQSTGAATVAANINYSSVWMATYNMVDNASGAVNPSVSYNQLNNTSTTLGGFQTALRGFNNRAATAGNPGYSVGTEGLANSQNQDAFGVTGFAYSNSTTRAGGYFEALTYGGASAAYAYVGTSVSGVNRKITGTNSVSEIVPTPNHGRVLLTCPESPEYWYQDYGSTELINGRAHVDLDPILAEIIIVNEENPIRVYCTPVDMLEFNGVTIMNKTTTGFDIVELNNGNHSGKIDFQIIVKPKTGYGEGRFPQAPGPGWLKPEEEPASAKAANQTKGKEIFYWPADWEVYGYETLAKQKIEEIRTPVNANSQQK
jgi:hypothetical protein